ncbi:metal transporter [Bradyrhizobium jicamae]|uniref:Metal transporter n=1 Tax=Bradyrhizobium jicamae TaxID=280332 RepID=A0A0R3M031_9BRAD|nr:potassium channel family protein [Bradyrhizobium jicamae]KRR11359.1 metal transporter [Bradyrhizobium jicamae]
MMIQLLVGSSVSVINIIIHALATVAAISIARWTALKDARRPRLFLMGIMVATVLVLMLAHTIEVVVWSLSYAVVGAAPEGSDLLYFAFVNYTTLGYGDVIPVKEWRLVGPMAAMNGILMFGWSTAVLFEVLLKTIEHLGPNALHRSFSAGDRS